MADETKDGGIVETIKTVVYALVIAGVFRTFLFQPFWIPSGSMKDTLLIGDFMFVNKMAYGYSYASCPSVPFLGVDATHLCGWADGDNSRLFGGTPERGDIIVFRHPVSGADYIKRLVGMPGDKLQMKDGILFINGKPAPQTPDGVFEELMEPQGPQRRPPQCFNNPVGEGGICEKQKFVETLPGGVAHSVINIGQRGTDNTPVFVVPEGEYFMMGDNRDNSTDSRVSPLSGGVGYVPYENLIGRADRVIFSSAGKSMLYFWTWRGDRFFKKLQ